MGEAGRVGGFEVYDTEHGLFKYTWPGYLVRDGFGKEVKEDRRARLCDVASDVETEPSKERLKSCNKKNNN